MTREERKHQDACEELSTAANWLAEAVVDLEEARLRYIAAKLAVDETLIEREREQS